MTSYPRLCCLVMLLVACVLGLVSVSVSGDASHSDVHLSEDGSTGCSTATQVADAANLRGELQWWQCQSYQPPALLEQCCSVSCAPVRGRSVPLMAGACMPMPALVRPPFASQLVELQRVGQRTFAQRTVEPGPVREQRLSLLRGINGSTCFPGVPVALRVLFSTNRHSAELLAYADARCNQVMGTLEQPTRLWAEWERTFWMELHRTTATGGTFVGARLDAGG